MKQRKKGVGSDVSVSAQSVKAILSDNQYRIPRYQRKYTWGEKQCSKLWEDLFNFHEKEKDEEAYFLGLIILNEEQKKKSKTKEYEVIDGQQRLITLSLLIKAFSDSISVINPGELKIENNDLEGCLFLSDSNLRLSSKSMEENNNDFESIIMDGAIKSSSEEARKCLMMENYDLFKKKIRDIDAKMNIGLIETLLNRVHLLKIESKSLYDVLDIFETINDPDRKVQLNDEDILKVQIIKNIKTEKEKEKFVERWNKLEDHRRLFVFYMHIIRAEQGIDDVTTKSLRAFFREDEEAQDRLKDWKSALKELETINSIKKIIWEGEGLEGNKRDIAAMWKALERGGGTYYWNLPICVFLYKKANKGGKIVMNNQVIKDLRQLTCATLKLFTVIGASYNDSRSKVRGPVYKTCAAIINNCTGEDGVYNNGEYLKIYDEKIETYYPSFKDNYVRGGFSSKVRRLIVLLGAYLTKHQDKDSYYKLLNNKLDIEHILPKEGKYYLDKGMWSSKEKQLEDLHKVGNLMPLERDINNEIKYKRFEEKKKEYRKSLCQDAKDLAKPSQEWNPIQLKNRDDNIREKVLHFLNPK